MNKAEAWNRLNGKKVLVHDPLISKKLNKVQVGIVVGCDPNVGICVSLESDIRKGYDHPYLICLGKDAPNYTGGDAAEEKQNKILEVVHSHLMSGYLSIGIIQELIESIYGKTRAYLDCPYSM